MKSPIVSFVIPTFNRSQYCISLIKSIKYITGEFEVIISDNSSDKNLLNYINNNLIDKRIVYKYTSKKLNMTENLNRAISFSMGHYVCCLGDDDTIMPNCVHYLNEFKKKGIDIISPKITINYCWPDFSSKYFKKAHQSRLYYRFSNPYLIRKSSSESYQNALKNCFQGTENLPKLYHGFVKREFLENIYSKTGQYLFGSSPDVSAAVLVSYNTKFYFETNIPMTIPGASSASNTGRAANKRHFGKLEDESQTKDFIKTWPELLPKIFTVETVWAHSAIHSLNAINSSIGHFNYLNLYAIILVNNKGSFKYIKEHLTDLSTKNIFCFLYYLIYQLFKKQISFFKRILIPTAAGGKFFFSNTINLEEAIVKVGKIKSFKNFNKKTCTSLIKYTDNLDFS